MDLPRNRKTVSNVVSLEPLKRSRAKQYHPSEAPTSITDGWECITQYEFGLIKSLCVAVAVAVAVTVTASAEAVAGVVTCKS